MESFKIKQIKTHENSWFAEFWKIYSESFPFNERRDYEQQIAVLDKHGYQLDIYFLNDELSGFICYWKSNKFVFIEHFAIASHLQGKGLGSILLKPFIENQSVPVILEIEPPVDEITNRRLRFYTSLGFVTNPHIHFQPPFHVGENLLPLNILTYPDPINGDLYNRFSQFQKRTMMLL